MPESVKIALLAAVVSPRRFYVTAGRRRSYARTYVRSASWHHTVQLRWNGITINALQDGPAVVMFFLLLSTYRIKTSVSQHRISRLLLGLYTETKKKQQKRCLAGAVPSAKRRIDRGWSQNIGRYWINEENWLPFPFLNASAFRARVCGLKRTYARLRVAIICMSRAQWPKTATMTSVTAFNNRPINGVLFL